MPLNGFGPWGLPKHPGPMGLLPMAGLLAVPALAVGSALMGKALLEEAAEEMNPSVNRVQVSVDGEPVYSYIVS